ncbi:hypothetical protein GRI75_11460 [Altererythrobacter soli]|uniref:DUF4440 domain-containing protein n=1 Tax=Croceibacterium soli TaxID=1739690 RepID=A0A6I4UUQ1_9SPHN|nr:hypothetical protein [Croceibacterium soli]MXP42256.1 hypothetical protein [Croceibacterium soli]
MRKTGAAVLLLALTACASGPGGREARTLRPTANPTAVIAAELAFARAAREKGQWTAFREYAADDAVMFVPQPVDAQDWLRKQQDPPQSVAWQPHQVWSSCDGSLSVVKGAWQRPDGSNGYFTTVWRRQRNGSYKWTMDQGDALPQPLAAPEMIGATVADCTPKAAGSVAAPAAAGEIRRDGRAEDGSLSWSVEVAPDGSRRVQVNLLQDGEMKTVLQETAASPAVR